MDIHFGHLANLNYLWLVAGVAVVVAVAAAAQRRALRRFATENRIAAVVPTQSAGRRWLRAALAIGAMCALVAALADVRWGKSWREVPQKGIEVVFALDVSRSMLAEDVTPNRLARAKQQIKDMVDELSGDRVGLVVFAGDAKREIPLTTHYNDFKRSLDEAGPQDIRHGGSSLGDAIRVAADSFLSKTSDHKAIVLFTDGEDHESHPIEAASMAYDEEGIRIFTVGLGDAAQGARVPMGSNRQGNGYLKYQGHQVWSKLDGSVLKAIAKASDGAYVPAGTKQVDMAEVYRNYVARVEQQDFETARINAYVPRFQWFVGAALLLTVLESLLGRGKRKSLAKSLPQSSKGQTMWKRAAAIAFLSFLLGAATPSIAAEPETYALANQASQSFDAGNYAEAAEQYGQAAESAPKLPDLKYNQAVALYRAGDLAEARRLFTAAANADPSLEDKARFNLANCDYSEALRAAKSDRPTAIKKVRSAISHYRGALAANPNDADARANIESAGLLLRQLQQKEKSEQEKSQQQQQQDQNSDQQSESSQDQQEGKSGEATSQDSQQESQGKEATSEQSKSEKSSESQSQDSQPQDSQPQESQSQESQSQESQSQESRRQESPDQQSSAHQSEEQQSEEQQSQAESAAGKEQNQEHESNQSNRAAQQETEPQSPAAQNESSAGAEDEAQQPQPNDGELSAAAPGTESEEQANDKKVAAALEASKPMTRQEAMKMLQSVRDRDLMRRMQKQRNAERQYVPGEKDW